MKKLLTIILLAGLGFSAQAQYPLMYDSSGNIIGRDTIFPQNDLLTKASGESTDNGNFLAYDSSGNVVDSGFSATNVLTTQSDIGPYIIDPDTLQTQITANANAIELGKADRLIFFTPRTATAFNSITSISDLHTQQSYWTSSPGDTWNPYTNIVATVPEMIGLGEKQYRLDAGQYANNLTLGNDQSTEYYWSDYKDPTDIVVWTGDITFTDNTENKGFYGIHIKGDIIDMDAAGLSVRSLVFLPISPVFVNCKIEGSFPISDLEYASARFINTHVTGSLGAEVTSAGGFTGTFIDSQVDGKVMVNSGLIYVYAYNSTFGEIDGPVSGTSTAGRFIMDNCTISSANFMDECNATDTAHEFTNCTFINASNWDYAAIDYATVKFTNCSGLPTDAYSATLNMKLSNCTDINGTALTDRL